MRVNVVVGGGSEQECLGKLPVTARFLPGIGRGFHIIPGESSGRVVALDCQAVFVQSDGSVGHTFISREHSVVHIGGGSLGQSRFL